MPKNRFFVSEEQRLVFQKMCTSLDDLCFVPEDFLKNSERMNAI